MGDFKYLEVKGLAIKLFSATFDDVVDQDQTAQNVLSDLGFTLPDKNIFSTKNDFE